MRSPVFDDLSITEHAARAAESVRAINHLSIGPTADRALPYPSELYTVVSDLARAVHGLPQALGQLAARLDRMRMTGRVRDADPDREARAAQPPADPAARAAAILAAPSGRAADQLARLLDLAAADLARLAYDETPPSSKAASAAPHGAALPERSDDRCSDDGYGLQL